MLTVTRKIGLLLGREWSWPPAFIEEIARRDAGVVAEYVQLDAERMDEPVGYDMIVDRISHEVPFYRTWLKKAVLDGAVVVNNPFMWTADDKFFGAALATKLGVASPRTVALPNKEYVPGIKHDESLRNLRYPLDWQRLVEYVGMPCILKDAHGGGWKDVYVCHSLDELIHHYDNSGLLTMVVQEFIEWDHFVRCICIGQEHVLPMKYDPRERKYHVEHEHLSPELGRRIVDDSLTLCRALGYDMNSLEFAVRDGVPYAIDFMNPAPDMDVYSLTPTYFDWAVGTMADMAIRLTTAERRPPQLRRGEFLVGRRFADARERAGDPHDAPAAGDAADRAARKAVAKHAVAKRPAAKRSPAKKSPAKKSPAKKSIAEKSVVKKSAAEKSVAKKSVANEPPADRPPSGSPPTEGSLPEGWRSAGDREGGQ